MKKKRYEGHMERIKTYKIYLNVNHLKKGQYHLKIIDRNKVIKSTKFSKE